MEPIVVGPDEGDVIEREGRRLRILAELPELEVLDLAYDYGWEGVDPHTHDDHVDSFFVLEGEVEFTIEERTFRGGPGTYVAVPRGVVHGFGNPGPGRIRVLNVHAPHAGFIERVVDR
jgi:mannose-6-phosphate isomerase-like protein (cupin superfamily)